MRHRDEKIEEARETGQASSRTPLDLLGLMGGKSRKVQKGEKRKADSVMAVYKDRVTYTFIMQDEVASIHFDRKRKEIFFRGHNITNFSLSGEQVRALNELKDVLAADEKGRSLLSDYEATLDRVLADK